MNLGELFFSTGFKVENPEAPKQMESSMEGVKAAMERTADTMERVAFMLGEIGLKMGAFNEESLDMINATDNIDQGFKDVEKTAAKKGNTFQRLRGRVTEVSGKFEELIKKNAKVKLGFVAAQAAAVAFTKKIADMSLALDKASFATGVDTQKLQVLGAQMKQVGGSAEDMQGALAGIRDSITNIELGKGDISPWAFMGIDPQGKDPIQVLDMVKQRLATMPANQARVFGKGIGLSDDMLYMLKEMNNLRAEDTDTFLREDEIELLKEFSMHTSSVFNQWGRVIQRLGAKFVPFVKHTVYALERVGSMIGGVLNIIKPLEPLIEKVFLGMALMAGVVAVKMFPLTAMLIGLGLALEDLWTFMQGGDSLLGRVIEEFNSWEKVINNVIKALGTLGEVIPDWLGGGMLSDWAAGKLGQDSGTSKSTQDRVREAQEKLDREGYKSQMGGTVNQTINVNGAQNPKAVVDEIERRSKKQNTNAGVQRPAVGY